jgi:serine/threonine-protein kinase
VLTHDCLQILHGSGPIPLDPAGPRNFRGEFDRRKDFRRTVRGKRFAITVVVARPSPRPPATNLATSDGTLHVGERIGAGSGTEVFVAWLERPGLLKRVAVKVFAAPVLASNLARIEEAVRAAALVRHPNVVDVIEIGHLSRQQVYVVEEMIDGLSLATLLQAYRHANRRMPLELALFIATEAAEGLAGAQSAKTPDGRMTGLAHLDLSPRAILLSYHGEVKVEGFGMSQPIADGSGIRIVRRLAPRLAAMAPEVVAGREGDGRSDVFSLGVLLSEMLVGPRFPANVTDEEACQMAKSGFVCPDILAPPLPAQLQEILDRALSSDPSRRQQHAGVVAYDLRSIALRMGVGDSRIFLRNALFEMSEQPMPTDSDFTA